MRPSFSVFVILPNAGELKSKIRELSSHGLLDGREEFVLQVHAEGPLERVQAVFDHGELVAVHGYRQLREGPGGGDTVKVSVRRPVVQRHIERLGGHLQWHKLRELEKVLKRRGVAFSQLSNERLSADLVSQYLNVKRRQLL